METLAFALPVDADKVADGYAFVEELTGKRADDHHQLHKMHGLKTMSVHRSHHPLEAIIVVLQGDDLEKTIESRKAADHEFFTWFDGQIKSLTGKHWSDFKTDALLDWHHEEGHRKMGATR